MKTRSLGLIMLAATWLVQAEERPHPGSLQRAPMPFQFDWKNLDAPAATAAANPTNHSPAPPLSPRQAFLKLATTPLFPLGKFQPEDHLRPTTLRLHIETPDGQPIVTTPVGLGMTEAQAVAWLAPVSETVVSNYDCFDFSYRAALVPPEAGGPGCTFAEARQVAMQMAMAGKKWPPTAAMLTPAQSELVRETTRRMALETPTSSWSTGVCYPWIWPWWGWYEYPSTAHPPASFSEQIPRRHSDRSWFYPAFIPLIPAAIWTTTVPPWRGR